METVVLHPAERSSIIQLVAVTSACLFFDRLFHSLTFFELSTSTMGSECQENVVVRCAQFFDVMFGGRRKKCLAAAGHFRPTSQVKSRYRLYAKSRDVLFLSNATHDFPQPAVFHTQRCSKALPNVTTHDPKRHASLSVLTQERCSNARLQFRYAYVCT